MIEVWHLTGSVARFKGAEAPLPPLARLPREEMVLRSGDDNSIAVGAWTREDHDGVAVMWLKMPYLMLPNDIVDLDDLRRHGLYDEYLAAVN